MSVFCVKVIGTFIALHFVDSLEENVRQASKL